MQYKMEGQRGYRIYNESESRNEIALKNDTEKIQVEKLEIEHIDEDYDQMEEPSIHIELRKNENQSPEQLRLI